MILALILAVTALSTSALLVLLTKLGRTPSEPPADLKVLEATPPAEEAYRNTLRDLGEATSTGRRQLLSSFAQKIRRDFHRLWNVLRFAIPRSANPKFGVVAVREFLTFRRLHLILTIRRVLGL